ncbi:FKBP-type peptidyl-prolyl cis-trans isomerase [bacterium]|nr:FKBP-type peptidyl-prolyl cis-trans isomerase [bacterium]
MVRTLLLSILILFTALCFAAAPNDPTAAPEMPDLESLKLQTTPSGLQYAILERGDDIFTPGTGQTAVVHYTGWLENGTKFDSSYDLGEPIRFSVGKRQVIQGWDEGVAMMGKGAHWILVVPPKLAYGKEGKLGGKVPIRGNTTLIFNLTLLDIE